MNIRPTQNPYPTPWTIYRHPFSGLKELLRDLLCHCHMDAKKYDMGN
jgi:hypothetical protein